MADRYQAELLEIRDQYRASGEPWPASKMQIAIWAVSHGKFDVPLQKKASILAEDLADALRKEEITSPSGARIRRNIAFRQMVANDEGKPVQEWLWDDVRTASHEHRIAAFRARHRQVRSDSRKLQKEIDVVNTEFLRPGEQPIEFDFNFNRMQSDEG